MTRYLLPVLLFAFIATTSTAAPLQGERIFNNMDKDANGVLTSDEAKGAVLQHFARIDVDSDRKITPRELHDAIVKRAQRHQVTVPSSSGFQQPRAGHRTSRYVPTPWPGYGCDDSPEVRGATYLKSAEEIRAMVGGTLSYPKSSGLRIVGTGHSWMAPGYRTLPMIAKAAGLEQRLHTHTSGGESGGLRCIWEKENGILGAKGRPQPKVMAAITTGEWDVMTWGSYTNDRPEYYFAWMEFCLKYNSDMEFYVFDGWPQWADGFAEGDREPRIENYRAHVKTMKKRTAEKIAKIEDKYPGKIHILSTCDAMMAALELYFEGKLPGVKGLNRRADGKSPSIWSDGGHLGEGMDRLEGYVFYATLYKKSPELIKAEIPFHNTELDQIFRRVAWQAVTNNPLSGVSDRNGNGIGDEIE